MAFELFCTFERIPLVSANTLCKASMVVIVATENYILLENTFRHAGLNILVGFENVKLLQ